MGRQSIYRLLLTEIPGTDRQMLTRTVEKWGSLSEELKRAVLRVLGRDVLGITAPSCTEPALPRRIRYGHRSWCVILVRMARRKIVS